MNDARPGTGRPGPVPTPGQRSPDAGTSPVDAKPSPIVPALLAVVAIMPELTLALFTPQMLALVRSGGMQALHLGEIFALMLLVPLGIVLLMVRRAWALPAFAAAIVAGLAAIGSPYGRIALGDVIVAAFGAVIVLLGRRRAA